MYVTKKIFYGLEFDTGTVKYLLEKGSDPNHTNIKGENALMHLTDFGSTKSFFPNFQNLKEVIKLLLEYHTDINHQNNDLQTCLFYACNSYKPYRAELIDFLFSMGVDHTLEDINGNEALVYLLNQPKCIEEPLKIMVDRGVDIYHKNHKDMTIFDKVKDLENKELCQKITSYLLTFEKIKN